MLRLSRLAVPNAFEPTDLLVAAGEIVAVVGRTRFRCGYPYGTLTGLQAVIHRPILLEGASQSKTGT